MSSTKTQDTRDLDELTSSETLAGLSAPVPRLRILYHPDLSRVGEWSAPDSGLESGAWIELGRNSPSFQHVDAKRRALEDPTVSRAQLRMRWRDGALEVEPVSEARRSLYLHDLDAATSPAPLTARGTVAPGGCVAIGDRVLLGVEHLRPRWRDEDRFAMIGESQALWGIRDQIRELGRFHEPVLIQGPTGTGKELVARAVHQASERAERPFVPVNCAALPESLVESVLFGHRKGAFTGADEPGRGLFEEADGGTLFLDELGELPLSMQPRLLRALQDGEITPVGTSRPKRVDVRILSATNRDLEAEVDKGELRSDLFYRVSVHRLQLPPLRERRFDIAEIFAHELGRLAQVHPSAAWLITGAKPWRPALPMAAFLRLLRLPLPGNVREIQALATRTVRLNLDVGAGRLPEELDHATPDAATESAPVTHDEAELKEASERLPIARKTLAKLLDAGALSALLEEARREDWDDARRNEALRQLAAETLLSRLQAIGYDQSRAARELGTTRSTLVRLVQELGLPRATDFDLQTIEAACDRHGGNEDAAAAELRVSPRALRKRLTELRMLQGDAS